MKKFRKNKPFEEHDMYTLYEDHHDKLSEKFKHIAWCIIYILWVLTFCSIVYAMWLIHH